MRNPTKCSFDIIFMQNFMPDFILFTELKNIVYFLRYGQFCKTHFFRSFSNGGKL